MIDFCEGPFLFVDPNHLNAEGAKLFSEILSDRILRSGTEARPCGPPAPLEGKNSYFCILCANKKNRILRFFMNSAG